MIAKLLAFIHLLVLKYNLYSYEAKLAKELNKFDCIKFVEIVIITKIMSLS